MTRQKPFNERSLGMSKIMKLFIALLLMFFSATGLSNVVVDFFGVPTCMECFEVEMMIENLAFEIEGDVIINKHNLTKPESQELKMKYVRAYGVPEDIMDEIPLLFIGEDYFYYTTAKPSALLESMEAYTDEAREEMLTIVDTLEDSAMDVFLERFGGFNLAVVIAAGLIDGVNPCAFVVLIFLVSYLYYVGRERKEILIAGMSFAVGIFVAYLAMGIGLMGAVGFLEGVSRIFQTVFYPAITILTGVLFVLSIVDFFRMRYGKKKAILELSPGLKRKTHEIIRKHARAKTIWIASLAAGAMISFVEFMCTGQIYLPTIVFALNSTDLALQAFGYLLIYNAGFTAPIIVVTLIGYYGSSTKKIQQFMTSTNAAAKIKLFMGGVFLVFFVVMLQITLRVFGMI